MRKLVVCLYVVVLCALLVARPVAADSESWTLWTSPDCDEWTSCDGEYIYLDDVQSWNSVALPDMACDNAEILISGYMNGVVFINFGDNYLFTTDSSTSGYIDFQSLRIVNFSMTSTDLLKLKNISSAESWISGVIIECYDPRVLTPAYSAAPTPEPATLSAMTDAGENVMAASAPTTIPMIIGLAVGMGIVVQIMRVIGWL